MICFLRWYIFSLAQAKSLIQELQSAKEDSNFIKILNENINTIYEGLEEENGNESDDQIVEYNPKEEDSKKETDTKSRLQQYERRVTRGFKLQKNDDDFDDEQSDDEKKAPLTKGNLFLKEDGQIMQKDFLSELKSCHQLEDLMLVKY